MRLGILIILLITLFSVSAQEQFSGDTVFIDDERAYISATPHTISGSGWVENAVVSKSFTGNINWVMLTNEYSREYFKPTRLQYYDDTLVQRTVSVDNSTSETVIEERGWVDVPREFVKENVIVAGKNRVYAITNIPVVANELLRFRYFIKQTWYSGYEDPYGVPYDFSGKYDIAVYPSSYGNDVRRAYSDGNMYILDPNFNLTGWNIAENFEDGNVDKWTSYSSDGSFTGLDFSTSISSPINGTYHAVYTDSSTARYGWEVLNVSEYSNIDTVCAYHKRSSITSGKYSGILLYEEPPTSTTNFNDFIADLRLEATSSNRWYTFVSGSVVKLRDEATAGYVYQICFEFNEVGDEFNISIDGDTYGPYNVRNNGTINYISIFGAGTTGTEVAYWDDFLVRSAPSGNFVSSISLSPSLDASRFAPYTLSVGVTNTTPVLNVTVNITCETCDSTDTWNYFANGTADPKDLTINLTLNTTSGLYETQLYPDDIYPEIYYGDSSLYWSQENPTTPLWRGSYHSMRMTNPFNMALNTSFYVEFMAQESASNSLPLDVYLVDGSVSESTFFTSDWRSSSSAALIASIPPSTPYHHEHTNNSKHYLIQLLADSSGEVAGIDVNTSFLIVLYSEASTSGLGWDFSYISDATCDSNGLWTNPTRSGNTWSAGTSRTGCPDTHVHLARTPPNPDGLLVNATATVSTESVSDDQTFYFSGLPNLAPNPFSFVIPLEGESYNPSAESLLIVWTDALDPNNDNVEYELNLSSSADTFIKTITVTNDSSHLWLTTGVPDGSYYILANGCDPIGLCTNASSGVFTLNRTVEIGETSVTVNVTVENPVSTELFIFLVIAGLLIVFGFTMHPSFFVFAGVVMVSSFAFVTFDGLAGVMVMVIGVMLMLIGSVQSFNR